MMLGDPTLCLLLVAGLFGMQTTAISIPYKPPSSDVLAGEGLPPAFVNFAADVNGVTISQAGWTVVVDSFQTGNEGTKAIDGNSNTFWHTEYNPVNTPLPHTITIDMGSVYNVDGFTYQPRQDGNSNGNIGQHQIFTSTDGVTYTLVAYGTFFDDSTTKSGSWETLPARYLRLKAITEAGNRGPWTSAAEINIYQAASYTPPVNGLGKWGPTINFPLVPVAATVQHDTGKVLTWSSYTSSTFSGGNGGQTLTSTWDPATQIVSELLVTNTDHDMFCPGLSVDFIGRPTVTGGNNAPKTSIFDETAGNWIAGPNMNIPRGYHASATCSDGRSFVIGGSWSGGQGNKNGEIYNPTANTWTLLPGCPVAPMLTADAQGVYRADNHGWLFGWQNGYVFQAGPSKAMNWYSTTGTGNQSPAGARAADTDSMCGNAVMYDAVAGKIVTMGGSINYQGTMATSNTHIITLGAGGATPTVQTTASMSNVRIFANAVVLPNGQVFVTGGQQIGNPFSDALPILTPEMWDPATATFKSMLPNSIPRTYHSIALLLIDGTVLSGGGGLCGTCSTNHFDAQIYTPQYLLNANGSPATRPSISTVSTKSVAVGGSITITTSQTIASLSLVRFGSATHTVDTDQRRIALTFTQTGTRTYKFTVPSSPGVALPGYWMLFAMNSAGVPSVAQTIMIHL